MRTVKINKAELLSIVRDNKQKHIAEYAESVEDYKAAAIKLANEHVALAATGDIKEIAKIKSAPPVPVSYEDSYSRAIRMLELSVDEVIEIEDDVFNQLVLDEWDWKHTFAANATLYKTFH